MGRIVDVILDTAGKITEGEDGEITFSDIWQVITDGFVPRLDVYRASANGRSVPRIFDPHHETANVRCNNVDGTQSPKVPDLWKLRVDFSNVFDFEKDPNPLKRPAEFDWEGTDIIEPAITDRFGRPITNTAGDPFSEPIEVESTRWICNFRKNLPPSLPSWFKQYNNAINSDRVKIMGETFDKETLLIKGLRFPNPEVENKVRHIKMSGQIHFNPDGWRVPILNRGFHQIVPFEIETTDVDGNKEKRTRYKKVPIKIEDKRPTEPQFLDKSGRLIHLLDEDTGQPKPDGIQKIVVLKVERREVLPFSALPLT